MDRIFDSYIDKNIEALNIKKVSKSFVLSFKSKLKIKLQSYPVSKLKIKVIASSLIGSSEIFFNISSDKENYRKSLIFSSRNKSEKSLIIDLNNLSGNFELETFIDNKRSKVYIERIILFGEYQDQLIPSYNQTSNDISIAFVIPYGIYGGAEVYLKNIILKNSDLASKSDFIFLSNNKLSDYIYNDKKIFSSLNKLEDLLNSKKYNIVVCYNSLSVYQKLKIFKEKYNFKLVEIYHSDFKWSDSLSSISNHDVDLILRINSFVGNHIEDIKTKSYIVKPSIDIDKFVPRSKKKTIGTVARLSGEKNLLYLIDLKNKINLDFVVIGSGDEYIKKRLSDSGIMVHDFKENIEQYYDFSAFVLPSKTEGLPITILESLASNIPVFSFSSGGIPDLMKNFNYDWELTGDPNIDSKKILDSFGKDYNFRNYISLNYNSEKISEEFYNLLLYKSNSSRLWSNKSLNPNSYFDKIFCINLDSRKDKWLKVQKRFLRLGLNVERYSAQKAHSPYVDFEFQKMLVREPDSKIRESKKFIKNQGEMGCLLSHLDIIKKAKEEGLEKILIFEDDVIFHKNFIDNFKFINLVPDWALLYLGASQYSWKEVKPYTNKFYYAKDSDGTFAYAVNLKYADDIIKSIEQKNSPIDWHYRVDIQNKYADKCFCFYPNMVIADTSDSDIRGPRELSDHAKILKWDIKNYVL